MSPLTTKGYVMPRVYARSPFMLNYLSPCYTQQDTREYFGKVVTPKFDRTVTVTHVAPSIAAQRKAVRAAKLASTNVTAESAIIFGSI